jgi:large subunit ribosomal protein L6
MSRVGKKPIKIPGGVKISIKDGILEVENKKIRLASPIPPGIHFKLDGDQLQVTRDSDEKPLPAYHGLARALAANNVHGVTEGFTKTLDIIGIGFKAEAKPKSITFSLGYSHPVEFPIPDGISIKVERQQKGIQNYIGTVTVSGADRQLVGQVAADIRALRKPDAYKGKGIRYANETVRLKVGKKGA